MVALCELESLRLAHDLIRAGLRLSIVRSLTKIGTRSLRQWRRRSPISFSGFKLKSALFRSVLSLTTYRMIDILRHHTEFREKRHE